MDPYSQPSTNRPSRWPFSKKTTIIVATVVAALIVIGIIIGVIAANQGSSPQNDGNDDNASLYYDRPGYDRSKLSDGVSDPFAVNFTKREAAISYQGQGVIQACNVLTIEDLQKEDLLIKANTLPTPISQTYNDGVGKAAYGKVTSSSLSALGLGNEVNSCNYVFETKGASVGLNVFQPFAVPPSVVAQELQRNYTVTSPIEGLEVFKKNAGSDDLTLPGEAPLSEYILRKGTTAFYIALAVPDGASQEQSLLTIAAKNFNTQLAKPTGPSSVGYNSPPLTKPYVRACGLLTNADVRDITGSDASPLVREGIASSTGLIRFSSLGDNTNYLNVSNECIRPLPIQGGLTIGGDVSVKVATTSFLTNTPAEHWIESQRKANQNNRERMNVSGSIGDEAVAYTDAAGGKHLAFRKGRIVVDLSLDRSTTQTLSLGSLSAVSEKLAPVAKEMAGRVIAN